VSALCADFISADFADLHRKNLRHPRNLRTPYSIHKNQDRRILCRLHHVLKLPVSRDWRFELGRNRRNGFEEAQQKTAFDGVVHVCPPLTLLIRRRFGQNARVNKTGPASQRARLKLTVRGAVQGVGFRPFAFRLATELELAGWVNNSPQGVFIEVEGPRAELEKFLLRLETEKPVRSFIQSLEASWLDPADYTAFEIRPSEIGGNKTALVLPDIATCPDCLREIFDPKNRRHRYPFTNCTNCGPRFSIIESLPYDRENTSMKAFTMCPECQTEYDDPHDRRFHAQPNACPVCGPRLEFWRSRVCENAESPRFDKRGYDALLAAAQAIREGKIVAVKGLGGFHLMADARNDKTVQLLRERKHREEKPFALMFPSLASVKVECKVLLQEERLLRSPEAPIVLLRRLPSPILHPLARRSKAETAPSSLSRHIAPGNPYLGVMLPYTPLHHLLLAELGFPVVATSGNLSDEPICTDEREALERLGDIADFFLVHNRPIIRHVDDSIVRVMLDRELVLRRARGYAPLPIQLRNAECGMRNAARGDARPTNAQKSEIRNPKSEIVLAVGAHLKNTVALSVGNQVFISQHIGDLETEQAHSAFRRVIADFKNLYEVRPQIIAADLHPDYLSTKFADEFTGGAGSPLPAADGAQRTALPTKISVQHHIAHVLSCMAENEIAPPALGVSWDGTGYGTDGTIWGGEFFLVTDESIERIAHLRPFRLPGGDQAVKEPRRSALGLVHELSSVQSNLSMQVHQKVACAFSPRELATLETMLAKKLNSPVTTSVGRLFDAVASLVNLRQQIRFEGQAAMDLEFAIDGVKTGEAYPLPIGKPATTTDKSEIIMDWSPMIEAILADVQKGVSVGIISAKFHNALMEGIVAVAKRAGQERVVLSGGCFQNRYLTEHAVRRLQAEGFRPYWHQRVPPNDGGIALGQVVAALRRKE
jgi:hydrogenase maturation protein HypF